MKTKKFLYVSVVAVVLTAGAIALDNVLGQPAKYDNISVFAENDNSGIIIAESENAPERYYRESSAELNINAEYPKTDSSAVNDAIKEMVFADIESFKEANGGTGTLEIKFEEKKHGDFIRSFIFTESECIGRDKSTYRKTLVFDMMGGIPLLIADAFSGDDYLNTICKFFPSNVEPPERERLVQLLTPSGKVGFTHFALSDSEFFMYVPSPDGTIEVVVPLIEFGKNFVADEYIENYWRRLLGMTTPITSPIPIISPTPSPAPSNAETPPTFAPTPEPYEKCIALTFDDGPNPLTTPALLEGLAKYNAKATFFVLGHRLDSLGDIVRQAAEAGHEIGNHTFNHLELTSINKAEIAEQIDKTSDILFDLTGQEVTLLRPPYGLRNETLIDLCNDRNLTIVLWNVDTRDWDHQNAQKVTEHIVSHAQDGAIMLMHDIYESTIEGTIEAVRQLSEDGWRFVTVDELIAMKSGDIIVGGIYRDAFGTVEK